jgi:hypothetical protein
MKRSLVAEGIGYPVAGTILGLLIDKAWWFGLAAGLILTAFLVVPALYKDLRASGAPPS